MDGGVYRTTRAVAIGQVYRFDIQYSPCLSPEDYAAYPPAGLKLQVQNIEPMAMRAAYLAGPYSLYVDCRPQDYLTSEKMFVTAEQPVYEPQLHPSQVFTTELSCHVFKDTYTWLVDVMSQMIFSTSQTVSFEITITPIDTDKAKEKSIMSTLIVDIHDTLDLWNLPLPDPEKPIHLVILTHGLHSNVSTDMLYLKEAINSLTENAVVKGFFGNVCKTERGVKFLGSRVGEYVVDLVKNESLRNATKVSFVGHSLGGLVQTFAIAYIESNYPWFFRRLQPVNFITLASPMLGLVHENPAYIKIALMAGVAGRTGHDLGLQLTEKGGKPLLLLLPSGPTHRILKRFVRRTLYANVYNDGIVPLRTSALLYLDDEGVNAVHAGNQQETTHDVVEDRPLAGTGSTSSAKIPRELEDADTKILGLLAIFSFFMPQKQRAPDEEHEVIKKLPKPLMLESATSILLPPLPPKKYITDPDSRENVILHDKIYTEDDLPPEQEPLCVAEDKASMVQMLTSKSLEIKQLLLGKMTEHYEEDIAREYHKNMSWRKVLVNLRPDAHNNIVVRRRFSNAFGWPVIDHLVENHFDVPDKSTVIVKEDSVDLSNDGAELTRILSMDVIKKENAELDKQPILDGEHAWLQFNEANETFDGPAGIFSGLSERVFKLKHDWEANGIRAFRGRADQTETESVMDGFM